MLKFQIDTLLERKKNMFYEDGLSGLKIMYAQKEELYGKHTKINNEKCLDEIKMIEEKSFTKQDKKILERTKKNDVKGEYKKLRRELIEKRLNEEDSIKRNELREQLIVFNVGLIGKRFKKFMITKAEEDEFVCAGLKGLNEAIEAYDKDKGSFSTIAVFWIDRELHKEQAFLNRKTYKPIYFENILNKWKKEKRKGVNIDDFIQSEKEISRYISTDTKKTLLMYEEESYSTINFTQDGEEQSIFDTIKSESDVEKDLESTVNKEIKDKIENIMKKHIGERNTKMVIMKLMEDKKLREIGEEFGVSRERARQIIEKSMLKIQKIKELKELRNEVIF
jgi:RNA polymerase primary sigma factor